MTKTKKRIGLYPGTFDPITRGHLDVIERGARMFDHLVVAVAKNVGKCPLFDTKTRVKMVEEEIKPLLDEGLSIEVQPFDTLLVEFADKVGASFVIRGLRAVTDFEYELQMAAMNFHMNDKLETVFLMATERYQFVSSTFVKEVARLSGDVSAFVTSNVEKQLKKRFSEESGRRLVRPEVRD